MPMWRAAACLGIGICLLVDVHPAIAVPASTCKVSDVSRSDAVHGALNSLQGKQVLMQTKTIRAHHKDANFSLNRSSVLEVQRPGGRGARGSRKTEEHYRKGQNKTSMGRGFAAVVLATWEPAIVVVIGFALIGLLLVAHQVFSHFTAHTKGNDAEDRAKQRDYESLPCDAYALAIASLIHDSFMTAGGHRRIARVAQSLVLIGLNISIQLYVLFGIKHWVCSKAVHDIRQVYDAYEVHMYGGTKHMTLDYHGDHRGIWKFFNATKFEEMPNGLKAEVCAIPFSQPPFFIVALFIWTLTCFSEVKTCVELFVSLILRTPRLNSMSDALSADTEQKCQVVLGLTTSVKACIFSCILMPRAGITCLLLWLGCRWLAATNNFMDLILNAVALEFILLMKDLVYNTLVPEWNKHDVERILIAPPTRLEPPGLWSLLGTVQWAVLALLWVLIYIYHLQTVLPEYRWDVRAVCNDWILQHYGNDWM